MSGAREDGLNNLLGIAYKTAAGFVLISVAAMVKHLSDAFPPGQTLFFRNFIGLIPVLVWVLMRGELRLAFTVRRPMAHFWRGVTGTAAMFIYFLALARLPLPNVTAITYASPLITLVLATLMLGEKVGIYRWSAVAVGMGGILLALSPHLGGGSGDGQSAAGAFLALLTALGMALVMIQLRQLTRTEATSSIVVMFLLISSGIMLLTIPFGWNMPTASQAGLLFCIGFFSGIAQLLLTQSYKYAPASVVAPFEYTTILWALALGFVFFGDIPQPIVLVGGAIVIAAGLYIIYRERQIGIANTRPPRTGATP